MFTKAFWKDTTERAVATGAQAAILAAGQDLTGFDVFDASWRNIVGFGVGGAVLAVLKALAALRSSGAISPASFAKAD